MYYTPPFRHNGQLAVCHVRPPSMAMPYAAGHWPSDTDLLSHANAWVMIEDPFFFFSLPNSHPVPMHWQAYCLLRPMRRPVIRSVLHQRMGDVYAIFPVLQQCRGDNPPCAPSYACVWVMTCHLPRPAPVHGR